MKGGSGAFLPYSRHELDDDDIAAVLPVLRGDWLTTGPKVAEFEAALCQRTGARFVVACANGTAGLHLAALALGLRPGDRVVVPAITFLATANAFRHVGAEILFADTDPDTGLITAQSAAAAIARAGNTPVKVMATVHLAGNVADPIALNEMAAARDIAIVEDAAHAIGGTYRTKEDNSTSVGGCRHGKMTVFSFHPVKTMTTGEGGAITVNDPDLFQRLNQLRGHGMIRDPSLFQDRQLALDPSGNPNPWYYEMHETGFNYRMTDIQCALGLAQLAKLDRFVRRRGELMARYRQALAPLAPGVRMAAAPTNCNPAWHLCVCLIDFPALGIDRATVMNRLKARGIGSQVHYIPVHLQPYYRRRYGDLALPGAEAYYNRCLSLPLFPAMSFDDVDRVASVLAEAIRH